MILNERKYAEEILKKGTIGEKPSSALFMLAKYYFQYQALTTDERQEKLHTFMSLYYPNYNRVFWEEIIENMAKKAGKYKLREINEILITKKELDTLSLIQDINCEKLLFTMLCHAKVYNAVLAKNTNWVNTKIPELFKSARLVFKKKEDKYYFIHALSEKHFAADSGILLPYIRLSGKNTNENIQLNFIDTSEKNEDIALRIHDFRELGYEYLLYKGELFSRCENPDCRILFRQNKKNNRKYCPKHRTYEAKESKIIICCDCGKILAVDAKNNKTCRCGECQLLENRRKKREYWQRSRKLETANEKLECL